MRTLVTSTDEETLEKVQEKLWCALPSIVRLKTEIVAAALAADAADGGSEQETTATLDPFVAIKEATVPFLDMYRLAECLFMACHKNPAESDVESGVEALLGKSDEREGTMYSFNDFIQILRDAESEWLEWHDSERKWLAVSEKQHMSVVKELMECVTQDVEPFALLSRQEVLTACAVVAHTKTLVTPFEYFVDFLEPREFPEIYDTLWALLTQDEERTERCDALTVEQFTEFFKWFYLRVFKNATEASAGVAARTMWLENLNAQGFMTKRNFVAASCRMCREYGIEGGDVQCLEDFFRSSETALKNTGSVLSTALFRQREFPAEGRMLIDPKDLYTPEELDEIKVEMEPFDVDSSANCIIICGKRAVEKTALARALAERLNCVHLSVEELALEAVAKAAEGDSLGTQLIEFVERDVSVPLLLLVALVRRRLCTDETLYRGYVFSDFPVIHNMTDINALEFFRGCGLLDVLVPNVIVHLRCDNNFYAELLDCALKKQCELRQLESQLREAMEEEKAVEESRRKLLMDKVEHLKATVKRYEELTAAVATEPDAIQPEELEAAKSAAEQAENELPHAIEAQKIDTENVPEISSESAERAQKIKNLTLRRIVAQSLAGEENSENEILVTDLPCFQFIVERIRVSDHFLTIGSTSLVENSVAYILDALQLQPCVLPRDLGAQHLQQQQTEQQGDGLTSPSVEKDMEVARAVEEAATEMGAIESGRWKRFCPVTFAECGVLVEGTARYGCVFRQRLYYLASEAKLVKFKANPLPYLRVMPLDKEPILLLSTIERENATADCFLPDNVLELIQLLHEKLRLTPVEFNEFVARWEKHRNLKEQRDRVLDAREKFELTERRLRAERLKKRKAKELRKKKTQRPSPKGKKGRKGSMANITIEEEEFKGWEKKVEGPETVASRIEKTIDERLNRQKLFVPILVHALEDINIDTFDQLLREGVLPQNVVVLQYERLLENEDEGAALSGKAGDDTNDTSNAELQTSQQIVLDRLETRTQSRSGTGMGDATFSQVFTIHRLTVNGKDANILATEILQAVCPGMPPVQEAVVDETLGEVEDEEAEMELNEDGDEEDGEGDLHAVEDVNPAVRPGKKFLNQFGSRLQYCPVTLYEKQLLVRGRVDLCAQYQQKLYVFASEEAKDKFERNPLRYLVVPPPRVPPRMWVVGYSKSGKKTLAKSLHEMYNVPCFVYDRLFFERCLEAARKPGGEVVEGIPIPERIGDDDPYLSRAESVLKEVRDFAAEQERCMKLRQEAEEEMKRREQAEERDEESEGEELDEEAEARLQEHLEFEPEADEDRELRLTESYLKIASYVTRIEPFNTQGYIMVCPSFSDGDMEVLFHAGCVPEVAVQIDLSEDVYYDHNKRAIEASRSSRMMREQLETPRSENEYFKKRLEKQQRQKERELRKWRRRHIGINDPESDPEDDMDEDPPQEEQKNLNHDEGVIMQALEEDRKLEQDALTEFSDAITERLVDLIVVNGDLSINAVFRAATRKLFKVLEHRRSLLHVAEVIRYDEAMRLLESGGAVLSYFGYTDPVSLYDARHGVRRVCKWMPDGKALEPELLEEVAVEASEQGTEEKSKESGTEAELDEETEEQPLLRAANMPFSEGLDDEEMSEHDTEEMAEIHQAYRRRKRREWLRRCQRVALFCGRLYFFENDASLFRYLRDPLMFVQQPPPMPRPLSRTVVSVYDEEHSLCRQEGVKRRGTANHIAFNLNCLFVSLSKLFSWAAVHTPLLSLSKRAIHAVLNGTADDALVADLLIHRLDAADARQKGVVLLNLPRTPGQYKLLLERGLRVDRVFSLYEDMCADVTALMRSTATVTVPFSSPSDSIAALAEIKESIDVFVRNEGRAVLSRAKGFPMNIYNTYQTSECIEGQLSSYQWFCPYKWSLEGLLVDLRKSRLHGSFYIDKYYYFSSDVFLHRFLLDPGEVTVSPGLKPLPSALPSRVPPGTEYPLELVGCCPVILHDTRGNRGLRGVLEPLARKGDLSCVVEYKGLYYALSGEAALERFMMCPWQYVEGASLPPSRKVPLPDGQTLVSIDEETYIRRVLYDPVAHALIAVAQARPKYPGLSLEESALKFMALHMKCFNDKNSAMQAERYKANYETFKERATLYKTMTKISEDAAHKKEFLKLCDEWEKANDKVTGNVFLMAHLQPVD